MRGREFFPAEDREIYRMAKEGTSLVEIAEILGRPTSSIWNRAKLIGIDLSVNRWTPSDDAELRMLVLAGLHRYEVAAQLRRDETAVETRVQELGIEIPISREHWLTGVHVAKRFQCVECGRLRLEKHFPKPRVPSLPCFECSDQTVPSLPTITVHDYEDRPLGQWSAL